MSFIKQGWRWVRSFLLSLIKWSFKSHASIWISDVEKSLSFYKRLGFRQVTATRNDEVVLLRNHHGDELNLVTRSSDSADRQIASSVSLNVDDLQHDLDRLRSWYPNLEITDDAVSRQIRLTDPDGNAIELCELLDPEQRSKKGIYHIATQLELTTGLGEHYYLPPSGENRFVRARARSAFLSLACKRIAEETEADPLVVEVDPKKLSIEEQLFDDADFDSSRSSEQSTDKRSQDRNAAGRLWSESELLTSVAFSTGHW